MEPLTRCGDDPKTTGHSELIRLADVLAVAVLNDEPGRALVYARAYQQTRIRATSEAFEAQQADPS